MMRTYQHYGTRLRMMMRTQKCQRLLLGSPVRLPYRDSKWIARKMRMISEPVTITMQEFVEAFCAGFGDPRELVANLDAAMGRIMPAQLLKDYAQLDGA
mmetsp:Transcript_33983/g.59100  ORF Transcript_33983/g.59100 Transcript_33983/m.59100 type:complete len:99 (+) Transcript_33983:398-694(+)